MAVKTALAVSEALYLKPLLQGLASPSSPFSPIVDIPAQNSLKLSQGANGLRAAFLSPIDYARHGGEYCIVPHVSVSSAVRTETIQLFVNSGVRNIRTVAVDIRVTSEIILAKIILAEKFRHLAEKKNSLQFIPMLPDVELMLKKADAALIVNLKPAEKGTRFAIDLVEEWKDLTELPYVHGVWVAREENLTALEVRYLIEIKRLGTGMLDKISKDCALQYGLSNEFCNTYFSSFSYDLDDDERESISEFFRYSFYHGVIGDIPDLNFFDDPELTYGSKN